MRRVFRGRLVPWTVLVTTPAGRLRRTSTGWVTVTAPPMGGPGLGRRGRAPLLGPGTPTAFLVLNGLDTLGGDVAPTDR